MKTSTLPSCVALTFPASTSHDFYLKRSEQLVIPYVRRILLLLGFLWPPIMDWAFSVEKTKKTKRRTAHPEGVTCPTSIGPIFSGRGRAFQVDV